MQQGLQTGAPKHETKRFLLPAPNMQSFNGATCSQTVKWKTCPMWNFRSWWADAWMHDLEDIDPRNATGRKTTNENHRIVNENKGPRCNENMHQFLIGNVNVSNIVQLPFCSGASKPCLPLQRTRWQSCLWLSEADPQLAEGLIVWLALQSFRVRVEDNV